MTFLPMKFLILTLFLAGTQSLSSCPADENEEWTYRGDKGPAYWEGTCQSGQQQSPIDIDTSTVVKNEDLPQLKLVNYDQAVKEATMENNGHTIEVKPQDGVERTISVNGDTYKLHQFHFHWGKNPFKKGSEHTIDGKQYQMEMHLVHLNDKNEIAVVGIFFQEQRNDNKDLKPIVDQLSQVKHKGKEVQLSSDLNLNALLPANPVTFYRYDGSLTTPGCAEGVTWSVVPKPMTIGTNQMKEFWTLYSASEDEATLGCRLSGNFRPVQDLNGREVQLSQ